MNRKTRRTGTRGAWSRVWVPESAELEILYGGVTPCIAGRGRLFVLRGDGKGRDRRDAPAVSPEEFRRALRELGLNLYRVGWDSEYIRVGRRTGAPRAHVDFEIMPNGDSLPIR